MVFQLEHRREPLLSRFAFVKRLIRFAAISLGVVTGSLLLGMVGYHRLEGLSWIDSFLNAAMILSGMGPVAPLKTAWGKFFAGAYALFGGIVFLVASGLLFTPWLHRLMHRFHLEDEAGSD